MQAIGGYTGFRPAGVVRPVDVKQGPATRSSVGERATGVQSVYAQPALAASTRSLASPSLGNQQFQGFQEGVFSKPVSTYASTTAAALAVSAYAPRSFRREKAFANASASAIAENRSNSASHFQSTYSQQASEEVFHKHSDAIREKTPPKTRRNQGFAKEQATLRSTLDVDLSKGVITKSSSQLSYGSVESRMPSQPRDLTTKGASADLLVGTAKLVGHVPGYTGHIPAAQINQPNFSIHDEARIHTKDSLQLTMKFGLPGYTGTVRNRDRQETTGSTLSAGMATGIVAPPGFDNHVNKEHHRQAGVTQFFNGGNTTDAETFYGRFRPFEGRMVI
eukprot:ANDGO_06971.mRNA.1 hypothetical protein